MGLGDSIAVHATFEQALLAATVTAFVGTLVVMPRVIRKLRGAGVVGRDINKPGRPEVAEMGGIGVFLTFNAGVFVFLVLAGAGFVDHELVLVSLVTLAGAAMTGIIDDLVELRQRFKAFIPVVFAAPLAIYVSDYTITFPFVGSVSFGLLYPLVLVPLGITCASNSFNMLEGYNGLGAGVGIVMVAAMCALILLVGDPVAFVLLLPFGAALVAFLFFNRYPARVFPGDTLTLLAGALLAAAAMIGKIEFWGALLFIPHILEFILKARGSFMGKNFADEVVPDPPRAPRLIFHGKTESLTHIPLKRWRMREPTLSAFFWVLEGALALIVVGACWLTLQ